MPVSCTAQVPIPSGCTLVATKSTPRLGSPFVPGHWSFGYAYTTGPLSDPQTQRTPTVRFAGPITVTVGDIGAGNSIAMNLSGSIPGSVDPYINGCLIIMIHEDDGTERVLAGWPGSYDGLPPANLCGGDYVLGQPFGSWSFPAFSSNGFPPWIPVVTANTTIRPLVTPVETGGIYKIVNGSLKPNDTLYTSLVTYATSVVAIPTPLVITALIGDE